MLRHAHGFNSTVKNLKLEPIMIGRPPNKDRKTGKENIEDR